MGRSLAARTEHSRPADRGRANGSLHELTTAETPSVIFGRSENHRHGNFYPASYRNICANPEWARRLAKVHTGSAGHRPARGGDGRS